MTFADLMRHLESLNAPPDAEVLIAEDASDMMYPPSVIAYGVDPKWDEQQRVVTIR